MLSLTVNFTHIIAFSDTHGEYRNITIPPADIIIHAGDACDGSNENQLKDFFSWFSSLPVKYKIFVAGNHDLPFELEPEMAKALIPDNVIFLENNGIEIEGIRFWSLPVRPWLYIPLPLPKQIDILITHGPPYGILDDNLGCKILRDLVEASKPKVHLFGHIHTHASKTEEHNGIRFFNVSMDDI